MYMWLVFYLEPTSRNHCHVYDGYSIVCVCVCVQTFCVLIVDLYTVYKSAEFVQSSEVKTLVGDCQSLYTCTLYMSMAVGGCGPIVTKGPPYMYMYGGLPKGGQRGPFSLKVLYMYMWLALHVVHCVYTACVRCCPPEVFVVSEAGDMPHSSVLIRV